MIRRYWPHAVPWCLGSALLLLTGCAALAPSHSPAPSPQIAQLWQQQLETLRAHPRWAFGARISAHSEDDAWNGKLYWRQEAGRYQLQLTAPFGQGGIQLDGDPRQVVMRTSDGRVFVAPDAETLLSQQLGWELPLAYLRYWVRGMPAPGLASEQMRFDAAGRLSRLSQADWQIDYPAYREVNGIMLPRKVFLENDDFSVRLVIDRWQALKSNGG